MMNALHLVLMFAQSGAAGQLPPASAAAEPAAGARSAASTVGFLWKQVEFRGKPYAYSVYVPPDYTPEKAWPVILFLHGSGERGSDGLLQTEVGIATAIRRHRDWCPALVVMPQCPGGRIWDDANCDMALACVEQVSGEFHLDPDRVYLTGLSLGGQGTWLLGSRLADRLAAIVPVCGFLGRPDQPAPDDALRALSQRLAKVPVWAFHGTADKSVPVERTREIVAALRANGNEVRYTEVPDGGHNVWDRAYGDAGLWRWMLAQKRAAR